MNIFLRYLIDFVMSSGTLFFAATAIVPEVSDAGPSTTTTDEPDAPAATEPGEGDEPSSPVEAAKPDVIEPKPDGRSLPPKVREVMEQLKTSDPKAHGFLKDMLFRDRAFRQELPGGLAELKTLKATVAELGDGGVDAIKAERSEWNAIDEAYNAADPKFLDIMVDANPESFNKIAPLMLGKFAQTDPEGYQRHMASLFVATLVNAGVPQSLRFLGKAVEMGDKENAAAILGELNELVKGWDATSKTQPKAPAGNPDLDAREQRVKDAEDKQWVSQTASDVNSFKTSAIRKELAQFSKGQQIDDETYEVIEGQALKYLNTLLMADPNFIKTFNAYCESKDRDGVTKYMRSKLGELLPSKPGKPGPVEKAYKLMFRGASSSTQKPRPAAGAKPGTPAAPVPQGWARVAKGPAPHEIDRSRSPFEMIAKQGAILKNGKKVFWGSNAPA